MVEKQDIRSYCNPYPPRHSQAAQTAKLTGVVYTEDKTGKQIDALIKSVRKGSIVEVTEVGLLAPVKGGPAKRRKLMAERFELIRERGGIIVELASGQRSVGRCASMILRGSEFIAKSGQMGNKKGRAGQPKIEVTAHEDDIMRGIWTSRRYKNDDERLVAIEKRTGRKFRRTWLWNRYRSPGGQETADKD